MLAIQFHWAGDRAIMVEPNQFKQRNHGSTIVSMRVLIQSGTQGGEFATAIRCEQVVAILTLGSENAEKKRHS